MPKAKLSSKGQITLPIRIREAMHLTVGETLAIYYAGGKATLEKERKGDILKLAGAFHRPGQKKLSKEDVERIAQDEAVARYRKSFPGRGK